MPLTATTIRQRVSDYLRDNNSVQGEATVETMRRFRVFAFAAFLVNVGYVIEFWFRSDDLVAPERVFWAAGIGWTHFIMGLCMLALGWVSHRLYVRNDRDAPLALVAQIVATAVFLAAAISLTLFDQLVSSNTTNFAMVCVLIGMASLMRPIVSLAIFFVTYLVFYTALPLTQPSPELLAMARSHGLGAVIMSFVASLVVWHQFAAAVLLRREVIRGNEALARKQSELEFLATHDALTGLFNRREFLRQAKMELVRSLRFPSDTSLLMLDLDHFKRINDQYGHPAGDDVLQQVAQILISEVRASDIVSRIGGEEFLVMLPNTDREGAVAVAEKLRCTIRKQPLRVLGVFIPVTVSIGISGIDKSQRAPIEALYATADQALYVAKQSGRDRVEYLPYRQESGTSRA